MQDADRENHGVRRDDIAPQSQHTLERRSFIISFFSVEESTKLIGDFQSINPLS